MEIPLGNFIIAIGVGTGYIRILTVAAYRTMTQ